jgi:Ca2+:H+ antiporter
LIAPPSVALAAELGADNVELFVFSAFTLVPLAWLIGEATGHAAQHTGAGVGGFLNASFGNAPELIIALLALNQGLPEVVRASLIGSVVSNLLLVFGVTQIAGPRLGLLDRGSLLSQLGLVAVAALVFVATSLLAHPRGSVSVSASKSVVGAVTLMLAYGVVAGRNLRRHHRMPRSNPSEDAWQLRTALVTLGVATIATALVSEILVRSLQRFAHEAHLSEFFIGAVIVAIVGNAAEHGGAVVIARAGNMRLATEIPVASSAQVALVVVPVVTLLSLLSSHPLILAFGWVELAVMSGATSIAIAAAAYGRSSHRTGLLLVVAYGVAVASFLLGGSR